MEGSQVCEEDFEVINIAIFRVRDSLTKPCETVSGLGNVHVSEGSTSRLENIA